MEWRKSLDYRRFKKMSDALGATFILRCMAEIILRMYLHTAMKTEDAVTFDDDVQEIEKIILYQFFFSGSCTRYSFGTSDLFYFALNVPIHL